jgi:hypothetical protein
VWTLNFTMGRLELEAKGALLRRRRRSRRASGEKKFGSSGKFESERMILA